MQINPQQFEKLQATPDPRLKIEDVACFDVNGSEFRVGDSVTNGDAVVSIGRLVKFPLRPQKPVPPDVPYDFAKVVISADGDHAFVVGRAPGIDDQEWRKIVGEAKP